MEMLSTSLKQKSKILRMSSICFSYFHEYVGKFHNTMCNVKVILKDRTKEVKIKPIKSLRK